ncbi:MAG: alcohol dehydrogenase catalytic domain-containing protein [Dehalococcoidia bacterium]|nr:alcohol dehydrogenase catalytic domain-containing protein [Dehalococcoidia bacterium]
MLAVAKVDTSPGLRLIERPIPTISGGQDVLVEVGACGICGADLQMYNSYVTHMQRMSAFGFPRIMGHEIAGTVREVGKDVIGFAEGDHVVCEPTFPCGVCFFCLRGQPNLCKIKADRTLGVTRDGGYAKYVLVNSHQLAKVPKDMPFEEAAMFEPIGVALHALEQSRFKAGDSAVVIGPGPLGILAAMLLQLSGIRTLVVAGRQSSRDRLAVAAEIGAQTVEIAGSNLEEKVLALTDGLGADVVFEFAGGPDALNSAFAVVRKGGEIIVASTGPTGHITHDLILKKELTIVGSAGRVTSTWHRTIDLIAHQAIDLRKVITHVLPLEEYDTAFQLLLNRKALKICLVPGA